MLVTRRVKISCIKFSLCILIAEDINPLNAELNPIRHLLAMVGARHVVHVSRMRVKAMLLLNLKLCRATLNPPVSCGVVVQQGLSRKETPDFPVLSRKEIRNSYSSRVECNQSRRVIELGAAWIIQAPTLLPSMCLTSTTCAVQVCHVLLVPTWSWPFHLTLSHFNPFYYPDD